MITNMMLLISSSASRDSQPKLTLWLTRGARRPNTSSDKPTVIPSSIRMKKPRDGSLANACTEVSTPERTRKVPNSDNEKVVIASNSVQLLNEPRFSVTASECINAVPVNQGSSEAFSTGSQNHQPPQPSS